MSSSPSPTPSSPHSSLDDDKPTFLCSAVLIVGPPSSISEGVARRAQANLPPPSLLYANAEEELKNGEEEPWTAVLDGEKFSIPQEYKWRSTPPRRVEMKLKESQGGIKGREEAFSWSKNTYESIEDGGKERKVTWKTVEIPRLRCFFPHSDPRRLFAGLSAVFDEQFFNLLLKRERLEEAELLKLLFETFGGTILPPGAASQPSLVFALDPYQAYSLRPTYTSATFVHPYWLTTCISNGFLLPTSVFNLSDNNPITGLQEAFLVIMRSYRGFPSLDLVVSHETDTDLPTSRREPFGGRSIFFDGVGSSPPSQSVRAVMGFVERCGATVVSRAEESDWIVTPHRKGPGYEHATHHPTKTLGTLHHLLHHLLLLSSELLDPYSNLLYFPRAYSSYIVPLRNVSFYISNRYSPSFRWYLTQLVKLQGGTVYSSDDEDRNRRNTIILVVDQLYYPVDPLDAAEGIFVTAEFVEYTFSKWSHLSDFFNISKREFVNWANACFSPVRADIDATAVVPSPFKLSSLPHGDPYSIVSRWDKVDSKDEHCPCEARCF